MKLYSNRPLYFSFIFICHLICQIERGNTFTNLRIMTRGQPCLLSYIFMSTRKIMGHLWQVTRGNGSPAMGDPCKPESLQFRSRWFTDRSVDSLDCCYAWRAGSWVSWQWEVLGSPGWWTTMCISVIGASLRLHPWFMYFEPGRPCLARWAACVLACPHITFFSSSFPFMMVFVSSLACSCALVHPSLPPSLLFPHLPPPFFSFLSFHLLLCLIHTPFLFFLYTLLVHVFFVVLFFFFFLVSLSRKTPP